MRVSVDGQQYEVPDDATIDEIDAFIRPKPPQGAGAAFVDHLGNQGMFGLSDEAVGGWKAIAKKLSPKFLGGSDPGVPLGDLYRGERDQMRSMLDADSKDHPVASKVGDVAGALLPAVATMGASSGASGASIGARLLRAVGSGAGWGGASGFGNSTADDAQGLLKDTAKGAGVGASVGAGATFLGALARSASPWLRERALNVGRRFLSGTQSSLSKAKPLADDAVEEAFAQGAIGPFKSIHGAADVLQQRREAVGDVYGQILKTLEERGVSGPEAEALAQQYASKAAEAKLTSFSPGVASAYSRPANQLQQIAEKMRPGEALPAAVAEPSMAAPLAQEAQYQTVMRAQPRGQLADLLVDRAAGPAGRPRVPFAAGPRAVPPPEPYSNDWLLQQLPKSSMKGAPDLPSPAWLPTNTAASSELEDALSASPKLGLQQAEGLKRSLQEQARSAYAQQKPGEVGRALTDAASMLRQANEDAIEKQVAASGDPALQTVADGFVPVKQKLSRLIQAGDAASAAAQRAQRNHAIGLKEASLAAGDPGKLLLAYLAKSRGTSTLASALHGTANAIDNPQTPGELLRQLLVRGTQEQAAANQ